MGLPYTGVAAVAMICAATQLGRAAAFQAGRMPSFVVSPGQSVGRSLVMRQPRLRLAPHTRGASGGADSASTCTMTASPVGTSKGPAVKEVPVEYEYHGIKRIDNYAWMKDDKWQQVLREPEVLRQDIREHLEAENSHVDQVLAPTKEIQKTLLEEMKGRMAQADSSVPLPDGPWAYFSRYVEGGEYPIASRMLRTDFESGLWTPDGPPTPSQEDLIDANELGKGQTFFKLGVTSHSPDHKLMAYSTDLKGSEYFTIRVKDIAMGELLEDELVNCSSSFVWLKDSQTIVYVVIDDNHREKWVYRHKLGTPQSEDEMLYMEPDDGFFLGVGLTDTGDYVLLESSDHDTSEVRMLDARDPLAKPVLVQEREVGLRYEVSDYKENLIILTNEGGAFDFKARCDPFEQIVTAPISSPGKANWRELVPHEEGVLIRGIQTLDGYLIRSERVSALPRLVVASCAVSKDAISLDGEHVISFDEEAYSLGLGGSYEHNTTNIRISYSSPTTPESSFDYDVAKRERVLRKMQKVPSGHTPEDYVCRRIHATAPDGVKVPMTVVHRKDTPVDGSAPLLLYGYGSYGISMPASFSTNRLSMIDRGFVYAIAHIRGGTDCGYKWYDPDGKMFNKKNTFSDFIACAEYLVKEKFTSEGNIAIQGGSAGGLLVGASMNLAREGLLKAVVGEVPFVDVLNTMCDLSLPLTPPEFPEWGNPTESKEAYDYIQSYSPYDQVTARKYPHLLATGGLTDPRVTYWEPAKWVAKVRKERTDDGLSLCKMNMGAGHAGKSGRFDKLDDIALVYAFLLMVHGKL